jgi:hypothetical protein
MRKRKLIDVQHGSMMWHKPSVIYIGYTNVLLGFHEAFPVIRALKPHSVRYAETKNPGQAR